MKNKLVYRRRTVTDTVTAGIIIVKSKLSSSLVDHRVLSAFSEVLPTFQETGLTQ